MRDVAKVFLAPNLNLGEIGIWASRQSTENYDHFLERIFNGKYAGNRTDSTVRNPTCLNCHKSYYNVRNLSIFFLFGISPVFLDGSFRQIFMKSPILPC